MPERSFSMTRPCFDGGVFCYCSGELYMDLISVVFWGLGGLFLLGVVEPSTFGRGFVPGRDFRVSSP